MSLQPNVVIWRTLLGACTIHGHFVFVEVARARLLQLDLKHRRDYVLLSNLQASERRWTKCEEDNAEERGQENTGAFSLVE